jgi:hypothetical protein
MASILSMSAVFARSVALLFAAVIVSAQAPSVIDAVRKGHAVGHEQDGVDAVRTALADGGSVNERDQSGWTPLMWAALECRAEIVKLLLDRGADVSLRANSDRKDSFLSNGQTAILVAAGCFIAHRRADLAPERRMSANYVAYELAAAGKMVRELIAHGANANDTDVYGRTPLMMAAMHEWSDAAGELLGAKAAVNARDSEGRLAIDYADLADNATLHVLQRFGSMPATGNSGRSICDAERALHMPITDCIGGRDFRAAVLRFQQGHRLATSGELDFNTRAKLGIR